MTEEYPKIVYWIVGTIAGAIVLYAILFCIGSAYATDLPLYLMEITDIGTSSELRVSQVNITDLFNTHKYNGYTFWHTWTWQNTYPATGTDMGGSEISVCDFACIADNMTPIAALNDSWALGNYWLELTFGTSTNYTIETGSYYILLEHATSGSWTIPSSYLPVITEPPASLPGEPGMIRELLGDKLPFYFFYVLLDGIQALTSTSSMASTTPFSLSFPQTTVNGTQIMASWTLPILTATTMEQAVSFDDWTTIRNYVSAGFIILTIWACAMLIFRHI